MANINIQTSEQNSLRGVSNSISFFPVGNSLVMSIPEGQRVFFEQGRPSLFPKSSSGDYSGGGSVFFNFVNGEVSGKDESSDNFIPSIPATGQFRAITFALNQNSQLVSFSGTSGTQVQVTDGVLSSDPVYLGTQPIQTTKLFTVVLSSTDGVSLNDIDEGLIFSYLNSLSSNPVSEEISYTGQSLTVKEAVLNDLFVGATSYQTSRTSLKAGDTVVIERTVGLALEEYPVTITGVTNGATNDTVSFSPALVSQHILELKPSVRVESPTAYNLNRALFQRNKRLVFDSGWIQVVLNSNGIVQTNIPDPLSVVPLVVWNSTKDSSNVTVLLNSFRSSTSKIGIQLFPEGGGQGTISYHIGENGVFYNFETSSLVLGGFIRIFLREI